MNLVLPQLQKISWDKLPKQGIKISWLGKSDLAKEKDRAANNGKPSTIQDKKVKHELHCFINKKENRVFSQERQSFKKKFLMLELPKGT